MNAEEAASLAKILKPQIAIPTHYGDIAGTKEDGAHFVAALNGQVDSLLKL